MNFSDDTKLVGTVKTYEGRTVIQRDIEGMNNGLTGNTARKNAKSCTGEGRVPVAAQAGAHSA